MEKIELNVLGDQKEVILRTGKAEDIKVPVPVRITGILNSVSTWLKSRIIEDVIYGDIIDSILQSQSNIIVDRENLSISLTIKENDQHSTKITGKLDFHPIFKKFKINEGDFITPFEMAELIKMNRTFFENKDVAMHLVHTLKNFKAKVDKQIEASDDSRGNKRALIDQTVESNLPEGFNMVLPVFKGQKAETIEVEVYIRSSDFACTLISPHANEIIEDLRNDAINGEIKAIEEVAPHIVIIEI